MTPRVLQPRSKTWSTFLGKLQERPLAVEYWNHYHLLGYWLELTGMPLEPVPNVPHSRHPQMKKMHVIIAKVMHPALERLPKQYDSVRVKEFLDWAWEQLQRTNTPCTSLTILSGEDENKYVPYLIQWHRKDQKPSIPLLEIVPQHHGDRSEPLPEILSNIAPHLKTWGDLAFMAHINPTFIKEELQYRHISVEALHLELVL